MNFQQLCELADKEIRLGLHDRALMQQAMAEAHGVVAHAHQIYWQLRAAALQAEAVRDTNSREDSQLLRLSRRLEGEEKRRKRRSVLVAWLLALTCISCLMGAYIFPRIALTKSFRETPWFYVFAVSGFACLVLAGFALVVSWRNHDASIGDGG